MNLYDLVIEGLSLKSPDSWTFYPFDGLILGSRDSPIGTLQISLVHRSALGTGAGHAECRKVLAEFSASVGFASFIEETPDASDETVFGGAIWADEPTFRRGWYRLSGGGLVLAVYQCPSDRLAMAGSELEDCEAIARTMKFA
jgi:hypothetical protein